jgi:hypothetical protein
MHVTLFWLGNFNPSKRKVVQTIFKNSVRTSKKTRRFVITKITWLMLSKEIIVVYTEKQIEFVLLEDNLE